MIFTDFIKKYFMEDISILNKEDFEFYDSETYRDGGKSLKIYMNNPSNVTLFFNKGFIVFNLEERNYDGYDEDIVCYVIDYYKSKESKLTKEFIVSGFWDFLRFNKCTKVLMTTQINPDFWINRYGFKLKKYEMELEL